MDTKSKILFWIFIVLIALSTSASYYRFMMLQDYLVAYEGECDPYTQVCFAGCEDDECTSEYYYSQIEKYAPNVFEQCGKDITDCESAFTCIPDDGEKCSITFCSPDIDGDICEELTVEDYAEDENSVEDMGSVTESEEMPSQETENSAEGSEENYSGDTNEVIENI